MGVLPSSAALAVDEPAIDLVYLARATLGDPSLEAEMLEGFGFRATQLMLRMQQAALSGICAQAPGASLWRPRRSSRLLRTAANRSSGQPSITLPLWSKKPAPRSPNFSGRISITPLAVRPPDRLAGEIALIALQTSRPTIPEKISRQEPPSSADSVPLLVLVLTSALRSINTRLMLRAGFVLGRRLFPRERPKWETRGSC